MRCINCLETKLKGGDEMNLTREQMIEALEICLDKDKTCEDCPLWNEGDCSTKLRENVVAYIKEHSNPSSAE